MIVLAFDQPHATLICEGVQTIVTYPPTHKTMLIHTLVGQTVAIARYPEWPPDAAPPFPRGAIVGSARVADVVPVVDAEDKTFFHRMQPHVCISNGLHPLYVDAKRNEKPLLNQGDLADFTPGRWAVILTDAAPCSGNGEGLAYPLCKVACHDGTCVPIPCEVTGPISEVTL